MSPIAHYPLGDVESPSLVFRDKDILRECGATIVENTDFAAFDEAIMSKCPDVIKSSDFKLRLAQHCASLTSTTHKQIQGKIFKDALAYMEYLANEGGVTGALQRNGLDVLVMPTCVAPIMPALGGFPMLSVPLGFYPEGTEIHWNVRHELIDQAPGLPFAFAFEQKTEVWRKRRPQNAPSAELPATASNSTYCSVL
ncbi:unnamed protein product [Clonostachys rhizophaga]|uniref:Amidase domain-containing protein n=1 Tax=Clonostachys rhizophaga TaxID=160324 RepID=A0A9N9VK86_9HYPO|nr:unnamed protein product [Clonostachys rhizophaga]